MKLTEETYKTLTSSTVYKWKLSTSLSLLVGINSDGISTSNTNNVSGNMPLSSSNVKLFLKKQYLDAKN